METTTPAYGPASLSLPATGGPGAVGLGAPGGSSEDQRRKWREKGKAQRARKRSAVPGGPPVAQVGAALPAPANGASAVSAVAGAPAPIPWNPDRLRKLWEQIVPAV